jgi:hypothetical protein
VVAHVIVAFLVPEGEGVCLNRPFIAHGCWKIYPIRLNGEVRALNLGGGRSFKEQTMRGRRGAIERS